MATLNTPYTFTNGTPSNANQVNDNFTAVKSFAETELVQIDGSVKAGTAAIADSAVTTAKIADASITVGKLAAGVAISGPVGPTGPTGPQGPQGPQGIQGIQGVPGPGANQALNTDSDVTFFRVNSTGTSPLYVPFLQGSGSVNGLVLRSDGFVCVNSASSVSLREYKENIVDVDSGLEKINSLRPRSFKFKDSFVESDYLEDTHDMLVQKQYGFIVEEVIEVDEDLVHYSVKDGELTPQMWKSNAVISLAVSAIQELSEKVKALEARIVELESK